VAKRTVIGLDIGTSSVRAAEVQFGKGAPVLARIGQVALPDGAVRDGEVVDTAAVSRAIKQLWSTTGFSSKKVVLGVANQKVIVRQVDLPWMEKDELHKALPFQAQDFIPMPVEQALLDFFALEETVSDAGGRQQRGLLVAASREMVTNAIHAVHQAGLSAMSVDLSSFAVLRALGREEPAGYMAPVEAIVDLGARVTNIVVHQGGATRFIRILLMGGQDITDAVSERLGMPPAQAEALKQQMGVVDTSALSDAQPAARVLESAAMTLVGEIRSSLDYYTASSGSSPIQRIVLTGGGGRLIGLAERLSSVTRVPVVPGQVFAGLQIGATGLTPEQLQFVEPLAVVPIGLALGAAA